MNAITNLTAKLAIAAMLGGVSLTSGCAAGASRSAALPMLAPASSISPNAVSGGCGPACATLLEPLRATIENGVLSLALEPGPRCATESKLTGTPLSVPTSMSVTVKAVSLVNGCDVPGRSSTSYFVVAVEGTEVGQQTDIGPISWVDGPNELRGAPRALEFQQTDASIPAGTLYFYIAYCTVCGPE